MARKNLYPLFGRRVYARMVECCFHRWLFLSFCLIETYSHFCVNLPDSTSSRVPVHSGFFLCPSKSKKKLPFKNSWEFTSSRSLRPHKWKDCCLVLYPAVCSTLTRLFLDSFCQQSFIRCNREVCSRTNVLECRAKTSKNSRHYNTPSPHHDIEGKLL